MIIITINKKNNVTIYHTNNHKIHTKQTEEAKQKKTVRMELHFFLDEGGVVKLCVWSGNRLFELLIKKNALKSKPSVYLD